ncbi:MAG: homoserine kinase [Sandaracinaceae bacterium]|nr:homoserine kinase [Sandaracinaceae bacterium]
MAIYTRLSPEDADRIAEAHGLGQAGEIVGVPAGSVNSNFLLETTARRVFVRIYEEQEVDGVELEWDLLDHLRDQGLPVPVRVEGPGPGVLRVAGKPTAVFEVVDGEEICQRMVDPARARAVGALLARCHAASRGFARRRGGRFTRADVRRRLEGVAALDRPELREAVEVLERTLDALDRDWPDDLPTGVVHGDLFRDNVRWIGDEVRCVLDWESAADDAFVYDLAVTMLAWCFGDALEPELMDAMRAGYERERPLTTVEAAALPLALRAAATRFTVTRITDYHLREGAAQVAKDWRRFYRRLLAVS